MKKLPGSLFNDLKLALVNGFPSSADLSSLARIGLQKPLNEIAPENADLHEKAERMVTYAQSRERIEKLCHEACKTNNSSSSLKEVRAKLQVYLLIREFFSSYDVFYNAVSQRLGFDIERVSLFELDTDDEHQEALYEFIAHTTKTRGLESLWLLVELNEINTSHKLYALTVDALPPRNTNQEIKQEELSLFAVLLEAFSNNGSETSKFVKETFSNALSVLEVASQALVGAPNSPIKKATSTAYTTLTSVLSKAQEESDLFNSVSRYRDCFQFAAEDNWEVVSNAFYDNGRFLETIIQAENVLIFGEPGDGKTAYWYQLKTETSRNNLVVSLPLYISPDKPSISASLLESESWLKFIRDKALEALEQELQKQGERQELLMQSQANSIYRDLKGVVLDKAVPPMNLRETTNAISLLCKEICSVVGFLSIHILIDIRPSYATSPETVATIMKPLLDRVPDLKKAGIVLKLFLPAKVMSFLAVYSEALRFINIEWERSDLEKMLARYIASKNLSSGVTERTSDQFSFQILCETTPVSVDKWLVTAARDPVTLRFSPRRLMVLARSIIHLHLARDPASMPLIDISIVEAVLGQHRVLQ